MSFSSFLFVKVRDEKLALERNFVWEVQNVDTEDKLIDFCSSETDRGDRAKWDQLQISPNY